MIALSVTQLVSVRSFPSTGPGETIAEFYVLEGGRVRSPSQSLIITSLLFGLPLPISGIGVYRILRNPATLTRSLAALRQCTLDCLVFAAVASTVWSFGGVGRGAGGGGVEPWGRPHPPPNSYLPQQ